MLLGIQICKNGRKFLHPNIKHTHFGHCYVIQRSKNWRQPPSRAALSILSTSGVQRAGREMLSTETINFSGVTCTTMSYNWLFPTRYHVNEMLRPGKRETDRIQVARTTCLFECLVVFKYIFPICFHEQVSSIFQCERTVVVGWEPILYSAVSGVWAQTSRTHSSHTAEKPEPSPFFRGTAVEGCVSGFFRQ